MLADACICIGIATLRISRQAGISKLGVTGVVGLSRLCRANCCWQNIENNKLQIG